MSPYLQFQVSFESEQKIKRSIPSPPYVELQAYKGFKLQSEKIN